MKNKFLNISPHGWANFNIPKIPNFHASYLTDVPVDLLTAIYEYKSNQKDCVSVFFDLEGSFATLIITPYDIYFILEEDESKLYESEICVGTFLNDVFNDIKDQLDSVYNWMSYLDEEDDKENWNKRKKEIDDLILKIEKLNKN